MGIRHPFTTWAYEPIISLWWSSVQCRRYILIWPCPHEITWDQHRSSAEDIAVLYNKDIEFEKLADRINGCSGYLKFGVNPEGGALVLKEVWFCRVRHCPVCQWRRSLRMRALMYKNIESVMNSYPSHRWIFLTLTVKIPMWPTCVQLWRRWMQGGKGLDKLSDLSLWLMVFWKRQS